MVLRCGALARTGFVFMETAEKIISECFPHRKYSGQLTWALNTFDMNFPNMGRVGGGGHVALVGAGGRKTRNQKSRTEILACWGFFAVSLGSLFVCVHAHIDV